jgi:hypothetical protein
MAEDAKTAPPGSRFIVIFLVATMNAVLLAGITTSLILLVIHSN